MRPQGVTVEEIEDEELSHFQLFPQPDDNAIEPRRNRMEANRQDSSEPDESQLGALDLQPLPFPIPNYFPCVKENISTTNSPSLYLQKRCPICFSGTKPNLPSSACVSGLSNSHEHANLHLHQLPNHSLC